MATLQTRAMPLQPPFLQLPGQSQDQIWLMSFTTPIHTCGPPSVQMCWFSQGCEHWRTSCHRIGASPHCRAGRSGPCNRLRPHATRKNTPDGIHGKLSGKMMMLWSVPTALSHCRSLSQMLHMSGSAWPWVTASHAASWLRAFEALSCRFDAFWTSSTLAMRF